MLSFWEKNSLISYHHIIIGAGITGLSTACELKERFPHQSVLVLERGILPSGASTKNAGFACIGSLSEKVADVKLMGKDKLIQLVIDRYEGLQLLRKRLGDEAIGFESYGGYELIFHEQEKNFLHQLDEVNSWFRPYFKKDLFSMEPHKINSFGFDANKVETLVCNEVEGQVDTGRMMANLWSYAQQLDVKIICGAEVTHIDERSDAVHVLLNNMEFIAQKIYVCTNAFTQTLFPNIQLKPGRGMVLATAPIHDLKVKGIFFFDDGYYYFKNFEQRIIFGGGRNLDMQGEETTAFGLNPKIQAQLHQYLKEVILPNTPYTIEHEWSGIMAFGSDKTVCLEKISERQFMGVRLNGMGVALGSKLAADLVNLSLTSAI
jgi:glycine/D-amino acid oxidase-like deaminating enzyme